jgi:hypothetical protein
MRPDTDSSSSSMATAVERMLSACIVAARRLGAPKQQNGGQTL